MYKRLLILASVFVSCVAAQAVSAATVDSTIHFRIINRNDHIEAVWKRYPHPKAFASYFIVRSEPGGPKAPEAGDIVATTTNRYSTNAQDHPSHNGTFYYRLCINTKAGGIVCSRVAKAVLTTVKSTADAHISSPIGPMVVVPANASSSDPAVTVLDAVSGELTLSLTPSVSGTILTWTPAPSLGTGFTTVLVRSFTVPAPSYPLDGYLAKIKDASRTSFVDTVFVDPAMAHAQRWYRVCAVDASHMIRCGAPVSITP